MKLLKSLAITLLVFNLVSGNFQLSGHASDYAPDFSGKWRIDSTWEIDNNLSNVKSVSSLDDFVLIISQTADELKVKRTAKINHKDRTEELTYYINGRGEKNPVSFSNIRRESKTHWENGKLVSKYTFSIYNSTTNDFYRWDAKDIWELSKDKQTLTITTEIGEAQHYPDIFVRYYKPKAFRKIFKKAQ